MFKPQQFGKYYLTERLAVGGMAEIYKAKLYGVSGFEKPMVVKQILPQYARNAEFIKMFIDEAKISVSLSHGNIIPVYELGRIDGIYYIAMEYVDGRDLGEIFEAAARQGKPISPEHAIFVAIEICKGLHYAHQRRDDEGQPLGVVHRDLSPANVLITRGGEVKIADFGIAKATDKLGVTDVGQIKGSHGYMSPEQVRGEAMDHRTDLFSVGILLHEMLTGRRLFDGDHASVIQRIQEGIVTLPSMVSPQVPVELDPVVLQALASAPGDRYSDANELQLALSRLLFSIGAGATSATLAGYLEELFPRGEASAEEPAPPPGFESSRPMAVIDDDEDATIAARATANATYSYAVRDDLAKLYDERVEGGADDEPQTTARDVKKKGKTLNLPALDDEMPTTVAGPHRRSGSSSTARRGGGGHAPAPQAAFADAGVLDEEEMPTQVQAPPTPRLTRPEVPELKIKASKPREPKLDDSMSSFTHALSGGPKAAPPAASNDPLGGLSEPLAGARKPPKNGAGEARGGLFDPPAGASLDATAQHDPSAEILEQSRRSTPAVSPAAGKDNDATATALPDPENDPHVVLQPTKKRRGPRSDNSVMALLVRPETSEEKALGPDVGLLGGPRSSDPLGGDPDQPPHGGSPGDPLEAPYRPRSKRPSGVFSSTMQLLVQGLEDEEERPPDVPRNIKPTILGWGVILLLVGAAAFFVIYKKTSLFGAKPASQGELLKLGDIKSGGGKEPAGKDETAANKRGSIQVSTTPASALVFLHIGDSPVKHALSAGKTHLLRVEREGYGTVHKEVEVGKLAGGKLTVTLPPRGAGQKTELPKVLPPAGAAGKRTSVTIASSPPSASVWLLVGQGKAALEGVEHKRHYFKVVAEGHQTGFLSISASRFDKSPDISEKVTLSAKAGAGSAKAGAGTGSAAAKEDDTKTAKAPAPVIKEPKDAKAAKATKAPAAKPKAAVKKKRPKRRRWKRRRRPKKKKKKTPKLHTPSWAS